MMELDAMSPVAWAWERVEGYNKPAYTYHTAYRPRPQEPYRTGKPEEPLYSLGQLEAAYRAGYERAIRFVAEGE